MSYTIARMNDEGNWVALDSFDTYSEAEWKLDEYWEMYPHAHIDIIHNHAE